MDADRKYLKGLLEALVFLSSEPIKLSSLAKTVDIEKTLARELLDEMILDYQEREGGFLLREIAGQYQFITSDVYHERLGVIFKEKKKETLSRSNLDTLAIIAYKQPLTLAEIDEIRGVSSRAMVANLISKKLVKPIGQKEVPGRPTLYGTTNDFLIHFGLSKLTDLPSPVDVKELQFDELNIVLEDETEFTRPADLELPEELEEDYIEEPALNIEKEND
ncbi:MAG: SMC-Scp complex subunit ScpB [Leptospiraceae bacterium]|nr:SMC-Scp complex subunit ScpB [Leptospiraceae bacterium]